MAMKIKSILEVNNKINQMEAMKADCIKIIPKTFMAKASFNKKTKTKEMIALFDKCLALSNKSLDTFMPDDNYIMLHDCIRILEEGIERQKKVLNLCYLVNCLNLNDRAQAEFDEAAIDNDKDKCILIINEEKRRMAEVERIEKHLRIRSEKRNKEVSEIEQLLSQWMDEDGRPRNKNVNVGNMNAYLTKLYPKDSIIEAYKCFLDTEPFHAFMRVLMRDFDKRGM